MRFISEEGCDRGDDDDDEDESCSRGSIWFNINVVTNDDGACRYAGGKAENRALSAQYTHVAQKNGQ